MDRANSWKGAPEGVRARRARTLSLVLSELGCLGMQPQSVMKFRRRLNMGETDGEQVPRVLEIVREEADGEPIHPSRMWAEQSARASRRASTSACSGVGLWAPH
ncbi:unnamed protein product [Brassica napus]|nr:unnamed protein product [Brassica napus]